MLPHTFSQDRHVLRGYFGCDSMPKIEHMASTLAITGKRYPGLFLNNFGVCQHDSRVKITLDGHAVAHPGPCIGKGDGPVHTQAIATGIGNGLEVGITTLAEQHHRYGLAIV